jgi:CRISPR/Cas system-associated exonuclease Cas4 (RecB family)
MPGMRASESYMTCPAKWYFGDLMGLSEPTTRALALGKAFHGTLARNLRQKLSTGGDMEAKELREVFAEEWATWTSERFRINFELNAAVTAKRSPYLNQSVVRQLLLPPS